MQHVSYRAVISGLLGLVLAPQLCLAQESVEDRMRDALRQSVAEMRAAQDQAAEAQAELQKALSDKAALQAQLDAANARLAAAPAAKPVNQDALDARVKTLQATESSLQQLNGQLQARLAGEAASAAATQDQSRKTQAALKAAQTNLAACTSANTRLVAVSEDVLHLYETQSFRSILLKSYEPLLGLAKVKLQNIVQQYDDKIQDEANPVH